MPKLVIILFIVGLYSTCLSGQVKEALYVKKIGTENGLPSSVVYYVFEDSKGFIWIATAYGLAKYNGYDFEYYTNENGLTDNNVFSIREDLKTGYIWFRVFKGGLCYYDGTQVKPHPLNASIKSICGESWISTFYIDSLDNIWFTSTNRYANILMDYNFYKIPPSNDTIIAVDPLSTSSIEVSQKIYVKTFESEQAFSVLSAGTICSMPFDTSVHIQEMPELKDVFLQSGIIGILKLKNGKILGYNSGELFVFDRNKVHHFSHHYREGVIMHVSQVREGSIFVCTTKGVKLLDQNYEVKQTFLEDYSISYIIQGKDGNYWFSTMNDGIFVASSLDLKLYLRDEVIEGIKRGGDSSMYVSTYSGKLCQFRYNPKLESFDFSEIRSKKRELEEIFSYLPDGMNKAELISYFKNKPDIRGDTLMTFFLGFPKLAKTIEWANDRTLMVGYSNGFLIYSSLGKIPVFNSLDIGFTEWVKTILQDKKGQFWIGTTKGLYLLSSMDASPIFMGAIDERLKGGINDIAQTSRGQVLVATSGNGVLVLDEDRRYGLSKKTGLSSNIVATIFVENDSSIWLGTNKGINHLIGNLENPKIEYYNTTNGFPVNDIRIIEKMNGHLFVAGNKGITIFKKTAPPSKLNYKTYLHHIEINNQFAAAQSEYTLEHHENNLVFHFRTIRFNQLEEYYYRLIGIDTVWQIGRMNAVRYNKLPYGQYIFEVRAKDSDVLQVRFKINPHFTQTWLFRGGVGCLGLGILIGLLYFFFKKEKEAFLQEQQMSNLENKALRSQMNPHFIFNAMNSIMFLIMNHKTKAARHYLYHFSKLMRLVLENAKYNFIPLQDEIRTLKSYLELEQLRYGDQIKIHWTLLDERTSFNYKVPPMMIQPIVENALIHGLGPKKEAGNLWINFVDKKEGLYIIIKDDGIGRSAAAKFLANPVMGEQNSSAIKNIKDRIKNINIMYQTTLSFTLENLYEQDQALGTKVTFFIPQK
ncbi:MAG: Unknown protein [uncultured Aureispira sp.]|uniref:Signal transduction histidine kinase internal region domain-containing protein n=1 Tax=uncultured Aureispira sp. TaxID=1331704 RepID=A0A6S6SYJ1_9BACT|nr:MAG: Unknown protein [uncultured Aureispira sp.]